MSPAGSLVVACHSLSRQIDVAGPARPADEEQNRHGSQRPPRACRLHAISSRPLVVVFPPEPLGPDYRRLSLEQWMCQTARHLREPFDRLAELVITLTGAG